MKTALGQSLASLVLVAAALFGLACNESRTPTEPVALASSTPTPTPTPTPIPQPATMSGTVTTYGPLPAGTIVECQGQSTTTSSSGAYSLPGLMSGKTTVTVTVNWPPISALNYSIELKPGLNTVDLTVY